MTTHELKTWPTYFQAIIDGIKTFEIRKADRPFIIGDTLHLREWDQYKGEYTGRETKRVITYIFPGGLFGVRAGYVVMGLADEDTLIAEQAKPAQ